MLPQATGGERAPTMTRNLPPREPRDDDPHRGVEEEQVPLPHLQGLRPGPIPRQSLRRGRQKSISSQRQWFSEVKIANIGAFEGFFPLRHSGVVLGSYLRRIDSCITQLKAHGPSRTCNESQEEEEARSRGSFIPSPVWTPSVHGPTS